ncbi:MAG: hypothetical protein ABIF17_01290 [Patescibacteria group bacterium]
MTLRKYLFIMILATLLCWGALVLVVFFVDPETTGWMGILIFYLAGFFAIVGTASVGGFIARRIFVRREHTFLQVKNSFRQAVWFGVLVVSSLFLQSKNLIAWWNLVVLILILVFLETIWVVFSKEN